MAAAIHDLRHLLSPLVLDLDYVLGRTDVLDPEVRSALLDAAAQGDRLTARISQLLEIARPGRGPTQDNFVRMDARVLLDTTEAWARRVALAHEVELDVRSGVTAAPISGEAQLIERALQNLVDNAIRHTPAGGRVQARLYTPPDRVCFVVEDEGPGLTKEQRVHLFTPFESTSGGHGLGLLVCQVAADRHGGKLEAHSIPGRGTTFVLELPRAPKLMRAADPVDGVE